LFGRKKHNWEKISILESSKCYTGFPKIKDDFLSTKIQTTRRTKQIFVERKLPSIFGHHVEKDVKSGLGSAGTKKLAFSMRNPVLGRILAILGKNTALRAVSNPNSSMENPNLRTEILFYVDLYVNQRSKK
jgi:hypothetical protein